MWRLTVRRGPHVERLRSASLDGALELLETRARVLALGPRREGVDLRVRRYAPGELVAARAELRGPQRLFPDVHAGVDLLGDGSVVAWTGRVRRQAVDPAEGESAYDALRRVLQA